MGTAASSRGPPMWLVPGPVPRARLLLLVITDWAHFHPGSHVGESRSVGLPSAGTFLPFPWACTLLSYASHGGVSLS
jgi:hypothetical protein